MSSKQETINSKESVFLTKKFEEFNAEWKVTLDALDDSNLSAKLAAKNLNSIREQIRVNSEKSLNSYEGSLSRIRLKLLTSKDNLKGLELIDFCAYLVEKSINEFELPNADDIRLPIISTYQTVRKNYRPAIEEETCFSQFLGDDNKTRQVVMKDVTLLANRMFRSLKSFVSINSLNNSYSLQFASTYFRSTKSKSTYSKDILSPIFIDKRDSSIALTKNMDGIVCVFCGSIYCLNHPEVPDYPIQKLLEFSSLNSFHLPVSVTSLKSCGSECFCTKVSNSKINWSENDKSECFYWLQLFSKSPCQWSCKIAPILNKPCFEIHSLVSSWDLKPASNLIDVESVMDNQKSKLIKYKKHQNPVVSCSHPLEKCNEADSCACFLAGYECSIVCRCSCSFSCDCEPNKDGQCCGEACACRIALRECTELCKGRNTNKSCQASVHPCQLGTKSRRCRNVSLLYGNWKKLFLGKSVVHGFGAFVGENVSKGELICEYVGDAIDNDSADRRGEKYDNAAGNEISFLFGLDEFETIDAMKRGAKMKFTNHSKKNANCKSLIMYVNMELRVGIYALTDIAAGDELFLDYNHDHSSKSGAKMPSWLTN